jgi:rRNA maturation endonuclease Nob1
MDEGAADESIVLVVLACDACGDTFPAVAGQDRRCRNCGSDSLQIASEPLL